MVSVPVCVYVCMYRTQEIFGRGKLANLANRELFAKLPIFTDTLKIYMAYALTRPAGIIREF